MNVRWAWRHRGAAVVWTLAVVVPGPLFAQGLSFDSPEQAVTQLRSEKAPSRTADAFGIKSCGHDRNCADTPMKVFRPPLDASRETAVLQIEAETFGDLVVLARPAGGRWSFVDSVTIRNAYEPMRVEFVSVVARPVQEIVVHNHTQFWGSAYLGHLLIIKLIDGRLRVVLTAVEKEYARMAAPYYEAIASFELAPGEVTQTLRASLAGRAAHSMTRTYTWDETFGVFAAGFRDEVAVSDNQPRREESVDTRLLSIAGMTAEDFKSFFVRLRAALAKPDRQAVCSMIAFPLRTDEGPIADTAACEAAFARVFTRSVLDAVLAHQHDDLFVNYSGAMIGRGELWIAGVCSDATCNESRIAIIAVNSRIGGEVRP